MMFGDIFDTAEELLSGEKEGQTLSNWERLPRNCADKLPLPEIPRKVGYPIGLKNQGATCYLNSLFQILFHTPQLRRTILQLPLCSGNSQTSSGFVKAGRHNFLLGLQQLFSEMSLCDQKAVGTLYLNKAFGWQNAQHLQQQDIQEAMRVIFDTLERALSETTYYEAVRSMFRGATSRYKTCRVCGETSQHQEIFYDLQLQVKNIKSVEESLSALTTAEGMEGQNAIFCEICQCKQDMWLGTRLQSLPDTLVFTLNRFDFDYEKMDRVRLNSYFEFQLQMDLKAYVMPQAQPDHAMYQLYGVMIHSGSAHGGHYTCFVRDLMQQTDWQTGLVEAAAQQARIKEGSTPKQPQKQGKQKEKEHEIKEPEDKKLLQNWFELNDNIATAIDAKKLASKFEGSNSAYILFYRRKSLPVEHRKLNVPAYFADPIVAVNTAMQKEREVYAFEKQHIILNINGQDFKLKIDTTLNDFKAAHIPNGSSLVLQLEHNGLPYYPLQIINHQEVINTPEETLLSFEVPHQSKWKIYQLLTPEYETIKGTIGKNRLPLEVVVLVDGEAPRRIISYSDENLLILRIKIQKMANVSYENQVITLITPYKQVNLTETLTNDDVLLPKLGIIHGAQLQLKSLSAEGDEQQGTKQKDVKHDGMLICFVIERDDIIGLKRFYFQKTKTLEQLLHYFLNMESLNDNLKRRFRNLNTNRLYYTEHYSKTLDSLELNEEMVRFRLERGQIPIKGDICVKIKLQSTLLAKTENADEDSLRLQKIFDPNTPLFEVKEWACKSFSLEPAMHKLYLTDWMTEPVRSLTRQNLTLFESNFGREETLCLRDIHSPIGAELVHLQVFSTITGSPDSTTKEGIHVKIQQFKTVGDLKELLIGTLELKEVTPDRLRLRQIKRDYMFGSIWREKNKSVKSVTINSNKIVYQILEHSEALTEQQIVVILKQRNRQKRMYENPIQLIFQAGKNPSIQELNEAVRVKHSIGQQITLIKYFHYNFQWVELSRKNIQNLAKNKKTNNNQKGNKGNQPKVKQEQPKKKQQKAKEQNQTQPKGKKQEGKNKNKKEKLKKEDNVNNEIKQDKKAQNQPHPVEEKPAANKQQTEVKNKKQKKGGKGDQQKQLIQQCQNLRKAPILLKDGDILGWTLTRQIEGDDFQTDEDLAWRIQVKNQPTKYKGKEQGGFKLNVDF